MSNIIVEKLNQLAKLQSMCQMLRLEKQTIIDQIIPPEIKAALAQVELDFGNRIKAIENNICCVEQEIKTETISYGATVKGLCLSAVWSKGFVTWDNKALDEYGKSHPEILAFRKQGKAFVSIRKPTKQTFSTSVTYAGETTLSSTVASTNKVEKEVLAA